MRNLYNSFMCASRAHAAKLQAINLAPMIKFDEHLVPGGPRLL